MAVLSKSALQRLAVLHALSLWRRGAYGAIRVQKALFFADHESEPKWRLFTFKKWRLGQYSDEVSDALNVLHAAGRVTSWFDGPAERLKAEVPKPRQREISDLFRNHFSDWFKNLNRAFTKWAYLHNDTIIQRAHDDLTFKASRCGEVVFSSFDYEQLELSGLDDEIAESLSDLVDSRLQHGLAKRLAAAVQRPQEREDWRSIYFDRSGQT